MHSLRNLCLILALACTTPVWAATVNINTADSATLKKELSGVGQVRAEAIIAYRKKYGAFKSVDELVNVDGIGHRTVESNRKNIKLK